MAESPEIVVPAQLRAIRSDLAHVQQQVAAERLVRIERRLDLRAV